MSHGPNSKISLTRHSISTATLCLCTLTQAYLLISVFPYAGYLVIDLVPRFNEENAGLYAGLIASSYMAGRTISSYHWGKIADIYGRRFVLVASLVLSSFFSILFGMAQSFGYVMLWRFLLGLSGGVVSTAKTAVTELAYGDDKLERRAMGLVVGMRGWGFLISPAIGGWLADPLKQYPNAAWLQNAKVSSLMEQYPFLLPNLCGSFICLIAGLAVACFIEETLPVDRRRDSRWVLNDFIRYACNLFGSFFSKEISEKSTKINQGELSPLLPDALENGTNHELTIISDVSTQEPSVWSRKNTRRHLWAYWIFSFVVIAVDEAFPLFCIARVGGLSLSEAAIGKILSTAGLIFAMGQYVIYAIIIDRFGLYGSLSIASWSSVPPMILLPLSLYLNQDATSEGTVTWAAFIFLSVIMGVCKIFSCMYFTSIAIASNKTVPSSQRATMNGLNMFGGSIAKGLGPIFSGALVAFSLSSGIVPSQFGSVLIFTTIGTFGLFVVKIVMTLANNNVMT